jgi:hypothetical protein
LIQIDPEQRLALAAEYTRKGYAIISQFVRPEIAAEWELRYRSLPGRKVRAGSVDQSMWIEQKFSDPAQALDGLAFDEGFLDLMSRIAGLNGVERRHTEVWINRYGPGDFVPEHCDRGGSTQLVICLQGLLVPEKGGDLVIGDEPVPLRTGDAVLFFARGTSHGVLPIGSAQVGPSGFSRVTCAIRLYAAYEN